MYKSKLNLKPATVIPQHTILCGLANLADNPKPYKMELDKAQKDKTNFKDLLDHFWINIDPFDEYGQFCDKGYSYRSVAFYKYNEQKDLIENSIMKLEKNLIKKL